MWKPLVVLAIVAYTALITPSEALHKCKNSNEVFDQCPNPCPPRQCGVNKALILCAPAPKIGSKDCKPGCRCKDGFLKNKAGICIPENECKYDCAKNETLDPCYSDCPPRFCGVNIAAVSCLAIEESDCERGCRCRDGYLRNAEGKCILEKDCPKCQNQSEVYDVCPAPCPPRRCDVDDRVIDCMAPPNPGDPECEPGCRCADGHARNDDGICIPRDQCPQEQCRRRNEEYMQCLNPCPLHQCDVDPSVIKCAAPPEPGDPKCQPGCECFDGYARNDTGICIPRDQCPPTCGKDEVYSACTNSECGPKNCSQLGFSIPCPRIDPKYCIKGCLCKEGFARAANGTCIPKNKCPSCGGDPKAVSGCGNCRERCSDYYSSEPMICTKICNLNGCECKKGLVLDDSTGKCIHPKKCVFCRGDYNAKQGCDKNCTKRCPGPKPAECKCYKDGCTCKDDFVYDPKPKKCVRPEQCTPPCGSNEVLSNCSNGGCGPWRCTDVGFPTGCVKMDQKYCTVGCVCQEGYVKDENERCIPIKDCPQVCKEHEVYSECTNGGCQARNCSQLGQPVPCVKLDPKSCIKGCVCEEGYLFARNGTCVPEDKCDNCNKPHEHYDPCAPSCSPQTCESIGRQYKCPITAAVCRGACRCDPGYFRNKRGECILKKNCLKCTGPNEFWSCGGACDNVCETLNEQNQTNCPIINIKCNEMCYCDEGYARNKDNICIPIEKCPERCTGQNEVYAPCPPSCPPQTCESINQTYFCPLMKVDEKDCKPACRCKEGFLRDKRGQCISKDNCLKCTGPNEFWSCGGACDNVCETLNEQNQTNCPIVNIKCNDMCYCDEGYARNKDNICIPIEKCPAPTCGMNEVYDSCANGGCQKRNCSQVGQLTLCIDPITCIGGCVCQEGYLRNDTGCCVPEKECPLKCTKRHEVYDPCPRTCPPQTCDAIGVAYPCPYPPEGEEFCQPACRCEDGYYRNSADECISEANCLTCTKPNEHFSCGLECDNVCATLSTQNRTNCPIKNKRCVEKCYCDDNYARDTNDMCIPIDQCNESCKGDPNAVTGCGVYCARCSNYKRVVACPLYCLLGGCDCKSGYIFDDNLKRCVLPEDCTPVCQENEVYNTCINGGCQKKNCADLGRPDVCVDPIECIDGCLCKEGFLRADNGTCVPINNCPKSCKGDPNAVPGCGVYCKRCSNYKREVACLLICYLDGCDCKPGYIFDDNLEKCVLPEDCTPVCQENEVYSTCINGGCQKKNCADLGRPDVCVRPRECIDGCLCKEGFLRACNGTCVPINKCPKPVCPKHEVFDTCANGGCNRRKCSELTDPIICRDPIECIGDCVCVKGRLRNEDGVCVPECQCNPICTRPHEVYNPCPVTCPPQTCESLDRAYVCPIESGNEPPCEPGCVCEEGFFRNKIGECISEANCLKCMQQHEYFSCGGVCDNVCETLNEQSKDNCPYVNIVCNEKCYCEDGYARNKSNICIAIEDCPPSRCGPNERWEESPCQVCEPLTCSEVGMEMDCPPAEDNDCDDTPGCICKYDFVRNDDGDCIPISECSSECVVNITEARARLNQGIISLSGTFLQYLNSQNPDENSVASSTSLLIPLAQLTLWAKKGPVLDELLKVLNLKCKDEIKAVFQELTAGFKNQSEVEFEVASKYYANENYPLSDDFKSVSAEYFDAEGQNVDFSQSKAAADIINAWVSDRTRGKIQDLVNEDMFDENTRLCLVNAIYFLGNWVNPFNPNNTKEKDFHKSNGETIPLKIMWQQKYFNYAENDKFQVLEMFYKGNNFSFVVVLPRTQDDFLPTLATISEPGEFDKIMQSLQNQEVSVSLPQMLIKTDIDLKELLIKNGVSKMFETSDGFEGLLKKPEPVSVSDAVQQAYISVDELGTEAAAATAVVLSRMNLVHVDPPKIFNANHPFIFYIKLREMLLFCGTFVQ